MDKEILQRSVINNWEIFQNKDKGIIREYLSEFETLIKNPITIIITGHRRVGKSTLFLQIADKYYPNNYYYLDFSDPALKNITELDYEPLYEIFLKEFGYKKAFFFDEIQGKPEWNKFVNNLRERGHKCFVTVSNADMLSSEISTHLTGRHLNKIIFPFSFKEFLEYKSVDYKSPSTAKTAKILTTFEEYLNVGGFPEVVLYNPPGLLKEIYKDVITKDIIGRWGVNDITELEDLCYYLLSHTTNEFTYNSLKQYTNIKDPKTIKKYIEYITRTYFLYELTQFDYSLKKQKKKIKKIYCIDNGFLTNVGYAFSINKTRFLENLIFIELKRRNKEIYFYKDEKNLECDFLVIENKKVKEAIQVCYNPEKAETEDREINGLISALQKYKLENGKIITYNTRKIIKKDKYIIEFVPAHIWLIKRE